VPEDRLLRNTRPTRLLHAGVYLTTFAAGATGIALWGEGVKAVADLFGGHSSVAILHRWLGYAVMVAPVIALVIRPKAVARFFSEASRADPGDRAWWIRFPRFLISPHRWPLARHRGHFDPGQRFMAWALVLVLLVLTISGMLMVFAVDYLGGTFGAVSRLHTAASLMLATLLIGHIGIGIGIPKGYRGVWRAMHVPAGGRISKQLARALWPAWAERQGKAE
jgi:cytochrome b subunit of formate dehydrogenase